MLARDVDPSPGGWKFLAAAADPAPGAYFRCGGEKSPLQSIEIHARPANLSLDHARATLASHLSRGSVIEARSAFAQISSSSNDPSLWTSILADFARHGHFHEAFWIFQSMLQSGVSIDKVALLTVLNACTKSGAIDQGRKVRGISDEIGLSIDVAVATAIVNLYGKCRELDDAIAVFDLTMVTRNVVTWTVMVAAYAQCGHCKEAFQCLARMLLEGILPNELTFVNALGSCGGGGDGGGDLRRGRTIHRWICERGMETNRVLANALVGMYGRCGGVEEAARVFESVRSGDRDVIMWTSMAAAYDQGGLLLDAMRVFRQMLFEGIRPDKISFVTVIGSAMPDQAEAIHDLVRRCGFESDVVVGTTLIEMLARSGNLASAIEAFGKIQRPAIASWSALVSAMVEHGYSDEAVSIFRKMLLEGLQSDKIALVTILGACSSSRFLETGKLVHGFIVSSRFESDLVVANALIDMYGSCRDLESARGIFLRLVPYEDVVSWNSMIAACSDSGRYTEALLMFYRMQLQGMIPDRISFISILNSISVSKQEIRLRDLQRIHEVIRSTELDLDPEVEDCFYRASQQVLATTEIENDEVAKFRKIQLEGFKPDGMMLVSILNLCARAGFLGLGRSIHCWISDSDEHFGDELVRASIIRLYGKCRRAEDARAVFDAGEDSFVLWNAFAIAIADSAMAAESLHCLRSMQLEGFRADEITLASILNACESSQDLEIGAEVHEQVTRCCWESNTVLGTAVISMFGRCGIFEESFRAFDKVAAKDPVTMNAMITACVQHREFGLGLNLFRMMLAEGMKPSKATFVAVLNACSAPEDGHFAISCIEESSLLGSIYESDADVLQNAIVTMHGRIGDFAAARSIFDAMPVRDSWNALMAASNEKVDEVSKIFHQMQLEGFRPNKITIVNLLSSASAASNSNTLSGRAIEALAVQAQVFQDDLVKHSFINLYAKLGDLNQAKAVFDDVSNPDSVSWNSLLAAFARNGTASQTLDLFLEMQHRGISPDQITFVSVLSACSHSGQAADGLFYFLSMTSDYAVEASAEHRGCMVDLLARGGRIGLAEELSGEQDGSSSLQLATVLGACHAQDDPRRGLAVAERLMAAQPQSCAAHVVLSNLLRRC